MPRGGLTRLETGAMDSQTISLSDLQIPYHRMTSRLLQSAQSTRAPPSLQLDDVVCERGSHRATVRPARAGRSRASRHEPRVSSRGLRATRFRRRGSPGVSVLPPSPLEPSPSPSAEPRGSAEGCRPGQRRVQREANDREDRRACLSNAADQRGICRTLRTRNPAFHATEPGTASRHTVHMPGRRLTTRAAPARRNEARFLSVYDTTIAPCVTSTMSGAFSSPANC